MNSQDTQSLLDSTAPIGVFDSGYGGLTVLRAIAAELPNENFIFVGDSERCPYGPRDLDEVRGFVMQICSYLVSRGCKMIVIACNTATAAGLAAAQRAFDVPVIGVVEPGARAAVQMTRSRRVGVIATEGTVASGVYTQAIQHYDAGIKVFSSAAPLFVEMAERGVQIAGSSDAAGREEAVVDINSAGDKDIAHTYIEPLRLENIDTLVLGCTHFPLIGDLISEAAGSNVALVSSAEETARDVATVLARRRDMAPHPKQDDVLLREYLTTSDDVEAFRKFGSLVMGLPIENVQHLTLPEIPEHLKDSDE